jgi:hypothetical protein
MAQALLIGDPEAVVARGGRVLQRAGRVLVADVPGEAEDALRADPAVAGPFAGAVPDAELAALDEQERLFASAWAAGREPKARRGDGLPWNAPGFEAP